MKVADLKAALNDFPPEADVVAELDEFAWGFVEYVELNEEGDVVLTDRASR